MAFPSDIGTKQDDLTRAWRAARSWAGSIKGRAQGLRAASAGGTATSGMILDFATYLADAKVELQKAAAVPGIAAYAQAQLNDPALNIAAEFTAMTTQIDACRDWIIANFPKDGNGWILAVTFQADGRQVNRVFTVGATSGLRSALDALLAAID